MDVDPAEAIFLDASLPDGSTVEGALRFDALGGESIIVGRPDDFLVAEKACRAGLPEGAPVRLRLFKPLSAGDALKALAAALELKKTRSAKPAEAEPTSGAEAETAPVPVAAEPAAFVISTPDELPKLKDWREGMEKRYLERLAELTSGDLDKALKIAGATKTSLLNLLKKHKLPWPAQKK